MPRLVQMQHAAGKRAVAVVEEDRLRLSNGPATVYDMALTAMSAGEPLVRTLERYSGGDTLDYGAVYEGRSEWRLLPPVDFPGEPARCLVTGTGLTHLRGARSRDEMHHGEALSDSMVMYNRGVAGGRPPAGEVGVAPEWFYKGCGTIVRAHNEPLVVPEFGESGGEESEIAGVYIIDRDGTPRRVGMTAANEFSDHVLERRNYLYLAPSKLRTCALGPELVTDAPFSSVEGHVAIRRGGAVLWERDFLTGEEHMCHSLANLEHHHFRYAQHRRPGDVHVHFFGVAAFSSGEGQRLAHGDVMEISFAGYGRPLRNPLQVEPCSRRLVRVEPL